MRSIQIGLLGVFTILGSFFGVVNASTLSSLYVSASQLGVFYHPPLNILSSTWMLLSVIGFVLGGALIVLVMATRVPRSVAVAVWVLGLVVYAVLTALSIWQADAYEAGAATTEESQFGGLAAIVGFLFFTYLLIRPSRIFFRVQIAHEDEAGWKGD